MKIIIDIPDSIADHCKEIGIPMDKIPKVFQDFVYDNMGFNSHWGIASFLEWTEEDDNISEYLK